MSVKVGEPAPPVAVQAYVREEADPVAMDIGRPGRSWTVLFFYSRPEGAAHRRADPADRRLIPRG